MNRFIPYLGPATSSRSDRAGHAPGFVQVQLPRDAPASIEHVQSESFPPSACVQSLATAHPEFGTMPMYSAE